MERQEAKNRLRKWGHDPIAFVWDVFDWPSGQGPTWYQEELLYALAQQSAASERGPHGVGKTAIAALVVLWFRCTSDDVEDFPSWMALTTAGGFRQLKHFLWPEIHKWVRKIRWDVLKLDPFVEGHDLLDMSLKGRTGSAIAVAATDPELIEGAHAERILYVFDEAAAIPPGIWDAAEGAFSGAGADTDSEAYALAVGKPTGPVGRFYEIHARHPGLERWWVRHVKVDEAIRAGRVSADWLERVGRQWGLKSSIFRRRALGEFAGDDVATTIPLDWIEAAIERWHERTGSIVRREVPTLGPVPAQLSSLGVDVAEGGGDATVYAPVAHDDFVDELIRPPVDDVMKPPAQVAVLVLPPARAVVDVLGIGAGVGARLLELGFGNRMVAYKGSQSTTRKDRTGNFGFVNVRSAAYWNVREMLDPANAPTLALPPDEELIGDLVAPRYFHTSGNPPKIAVEPKKDVVARLGRSPDAGDAVVMSLWRDLGGPASTNVAALTSRRIG